MRKLWTRLGAVLLVSVVACAMPDTDDQDEYGDVEQEGSNGGSNGGRSVPDAWDCWTYKGSGAQHLTGDYHDPTNGATRTCPRGKGCTVNEEDTSCTPVAAQGNGCWSDSNTCRPDHRGSGAGGGSAQ